MLRDKSLGELATPLVGGSLVVAMLWAAYQIGPIAISRWLGL